jgi:hypothetical protein
MSGQFIPKMAILPAAQQRLWPELAAAAGLGFVLYGGTAIALRLGHRSSIDFDFFCDAPLDRSQLQTTFSFMAQSLVLQDQANAYSVLVPYGDANHQHVKVSFFGTINFGRAGEPDVTDDGVMQVAALEDLMATKLKVILQRAEAKDYRDIAAMLNAGVSLAHGLALAREFFGPNFQPSESLKALVYFQDGDLKTLSKAEQQTLTQAASRVRELPVCRVQSYQLAR